VKENEEKPHRPEDETNAYKILQERHLNDDRLLAERTYLFLAGSSILFLGFAALDVWILRLIVTILGLAISIFAILGNHRTKKGLDFWEEKEKEIEEEGQSFIYMKGRQMSPHLVYNRIGGIRNRIIYAYVLPSLFAFLWISSSYWVIYSRLCS
jgi:hypothetical protein